MSEFDRFLCQCKPRVKETLARRSGELSEEEVAFVLRHHEWQIEQFLSLVISAGMTGALKYLSMYGGQAPVMGGMAQTLDFRQIAKDRFRDGKSYNYIDVAAWIADTYRIPLDRYLKQSVNSALTHLRIIEELFIVSDHNTPGLCLYSARRSATVDRKPITRYRAWAMEVRQVLKNGGAMTTQEIANGLCAEIDPVQRKSITDALNTLYRQGLVEFRGRKGAGRQYALVDQEAMKCCG
jgi:hypothetical protein